MSEHVEKDYYRGFIETGIGACVSHSEYEKICSLFITKRTEDSWHTSQQAEFTDYNNDEENLLFYTPLHSQWVGSVQRDKKKYPVIGGENGNKY